MGAQRTYQRRFEHQAGQRLTRSYAELADAEVPEDFLDLLKQADKRRCDRKDKNPQFANS